MGGSKATSFALSVTLSVLMFAAMQLFKTQLASSQLMTILGGFLGHVLFILILTAVSNFEGLAFGYAFKTQLFPEIIACMALAMFASALVHRVCVTTCLIFSVVALYYINKISVSIYGAGTPAVAVAPTKTKGSKKRN